ncbi:hypothetical protein A3D11_03840 [Candidatus Peribacteria bacterium RIFCSPHIGHO2_02_FULL_49_16]|nr:MAG: hypothetical protein A2880_04800 [Candidatus Peribacteria bacterium RIFCSPHIGHO2_01_FULL_49_38]OGJ58865.1 MAG: hypothetical protein A3D11_03840 [Candidatus Peribacteria bacterium RIFCSPHIGHO2_02_FULL_49_16]
MFHSLFYAKRWHALVFCSALFLGILVSMPHILHILDERYQGIPVHLNSDEFSYLPRVQEALIGRSDRLGTAVTGGDEKLPELQAALIERVYGTIFRPFNARAATVLTMMDFIIPFFLFCILIGFCQSCGFSRKHAYIIVVLFSLLELYNLGRPIHQRASFLLTILAMWGLISGVQYHFFWGVLGGMLMGLLFNVYFWSFSAAWTWWAVLVVLFFLNALSIRPHQRQRSSFLTHIIHCVRRKEKCTAEWRSLGYVLLFGGVGFVFAAPFLFHAFSISSDPIYGEAFFRSGVGMSRIPESWPWTILFALMALAVTVTWYRRPISTPLTCTVITGFLVLNQQVIHGVRFLFASHYLFTLVLAALFALIALWRDRYVPALLGSIAALVFIAGIAYDNRSVVSQWRVDAEDFREQHLASSLPVLDELQRSVILSDSLTSSFIASHTHHDVIFTNYIQHELRSHRELAERYCLTQMPLNVSHRRPEDEIVLIYGDAYDGMYTQEERTRLRQEELNLVTVTCADIEGRLQEFLEKYHVQYVVWDEKRQVKWDLGRITGLELIERGEGWSVWIHEINNR